ncbi:hypothetical protein EPICR_20215 [Candidatus Desulfarcum epimagneticum]|uniref:Uncharacterized protein n=1 Tax=uncultured Desulfobacteraceae bacterium TaxID=218296 RepID=A0A484HHC8_9BACT|nr:hypothetical protein EPICR_20215 [uncultured Desulfobacteraceae bacterium]
MTFRLHKTSIYFKRFFPFTSFEKDSFSKICDEIKRFPLEEDFPAIRGLCLEGEGFFKKILVDEAEEVDINDIERIKSITPIVDDGLFLPFIFERSQFEVILPTEGKSIEQLMASITTIDDYLNALVEDIIGEKIEIHLRPRAPEKQTLDRFFKYTAPNLSRGTYAYHISAGGKSETGETDLPAPFEDLPANIKQFAEMIQGFKEMMRGPYSMALMKNKNKLVLKKLKQYEIGLSLYSDQSRWFKEALMKCDDAGLFGGRLIPPYLKNMPVLGSKAA